MYTVDENRCPNAGATELTSVQLAIDDELLKLPGRCTR
jgi:hypothetical protein